MQHGRNTIEAVAKAADCTVLMHPRVDAFLKKSLPKPHAIREVIIQSVGEKLAAFAVWSLTRGVNRSGALPGGAFRVVLSADHTFKMAKAIRALKSRPYAAVFTVMNSDNEVVIQKLVRDLSFASIKSCFQQLEQRLIDMSAGINSPSAPNIPFYIDNCCSYKNLILEAMPRLKNKIVIKLDLFHWLRRWTRRVKLSTPEGKYVMSRIRSIIYHGEAKVIRAAAELLPEFSMLQATPQWQVVRDRNMLWERVWGNQLSHLDCLTDPDGGHGLARRGTQEPYHASLNDKVCTRYHNWHHARASNAPPQPH